MTQKEFSLLCEAEAKLKVAIYILTNPSDYKRGAAKRAALPRITEALASIESAFDAHLNQTIST